jgi:nicotinamidase-related amidase
MSAATTALLLCDLQNDFVHPEGAYGRAGLRAPEISALPARLAPLAARLRAAGGWVAATQFTLVPGRDGAPLVSPHLQNLRPFLGKGDFLPGAWGHRMVDELHPIDLAVEKIAYSAFYMTRLEWLLRRCGITRLLVAGIVTNGGVASTVRDAHVRDFPCTLLEDGCAAFTPAVHDTAVAALRHLCPCEPIAASMARL